MRKLFTLIAALAILGMLATSAIATVTLDPATGSGFVGKGDVQIPFGWSNKQLQTNASGVTFTYVESITQTQDCVTVDGQGRDRVVTVTGNRTKTLGVNGAIAYDARVKNQITGFTLRGFSGDATETNSGWSDCPEGSQQRGEVIEDVASELRATHSSGSHVIWTPPAPV